MRKISRVQRPTNRALRPDEARAIADLEMAALARRLVARFGVAVTVDILRRAADDLLPPTPRT
jgi:hypothetical protein